MSPCLYHGSRNRDSNHGHPAEGGGDDGGGEERAMVPLPLLLRLARASPLDTEKMKKCK